MPPPLLLVLFFLLAPPPTAPQPVPSGAGALPGPAEDDLRCLRGVKSDLNDPDGRLGDWSFANASAGAVCDFSGVTCWNPQESRVISLSLSGFGLQGPVPSSLQYCHATVVLNLSGNALEGQIPPVLCDWMPFLVNLDLSDNRLSGPLPAELANCNLLNSLKLSGNSLSGQIPASLNHLAHLKSLDLSGNRLDGQIPAQLGATFPKESFSGNKGLCGRPLSSRCGGGLQGTGLAIVIAAGVFGAAAGLLLAYFIWLKI